MDFVTVAMSVFLAYAVYQSIENYFFVPSIAVGLTDEERKGKTGKKGYQIRLFLKNLCRVTTQGRWTF